MCTHRNIKISIANSFSFQFTFFTTICIIEIRVVSWKEYYDMLNTLTLQGPPFSKGAESTSPTTVLQCWVQPLHSEQNWTVERAKTLRQITDFLLGTMECARITTRFVHFNVAACAGLLNTSNISDRRKQYSQDLGCSIFKARGLYCWSLHS
jgi:hypothetical protein